MGRLIMIFCVVEYSCAQRVSSKHGPPLWGGCESHKLPSDTRSVFSIGCVGFSGEKGEVADGESRNRSQVRH